MLEIPILIVLMFATWRVSALLTYEAGPIDCFLRLREFAGITHDDQGEPIEHNGSFLAKVLECLWCNSIWTGAVITTGYIVLPRNIITYLLLPFVLSAGAILLERGIRG
jgi:hypothetical protein